MDVVGRPVLGRCSAGLEDSAAVDGCGSAVTEDQCSLDIDLWSAGGMSVLLGGGVMSLSTASRIAASVEMWEVEEGLSPVGSEGRRSKSIMSD